MPGIKMQRIGEEPSTGKRTQKQKTRPNENVLFLSFGSCVFCTGRAKCQEYLQHYLFGGMVAAFFFFLFPTPKISEILSPSFLQATPAPVDNRRCSFACRISNTWR